MADSIQKKVGNADLVYIDGKIFKNLNGFVEFTQEEIDSVDFTKYIVSQDMRIINLETIKTNS